MEEYEIFILKLIKNNKKSVIAACTVLMVSNPLHIDITGNESELWELDMES
jgi:hypothetical protein